MVNIQKANLVKNINIRYDSYTHLNNVIVFAKCNLAELQADFPILAGVSSRVNAFIEELKIYSDIQSLNDIPLPDVSDNNTNTENLLNTIAAEWTPERYQVCIWSTDKLDTPITDLTKWCLEGKHSLTSPQGYPYRMYQTMNLITNKVARKFGQGGMFGFSLEDVGKGLPKQNDHIAITGCYSLEYISFQDDPKPTVIYVVGGSSSTSQSNTPATPPEISISYTPSGDVYVADETTLTINIAKLTPNTDFFLQWIKSDSVLKTDTYKADANGAYTLSLNSRTFLSSPYTGSGVYKVKIIQNALGAETPTFNVIAPSVSLNRTSFMQDDGTTFLATFSGYRPNTTVSLTWLKGGTALSASTTNQTLSSNPYSKSYSSSFFNGSPYNGAGTYKLQVTKGQVTILTGDLAVTPYTPPSYAPALS